MMPIAEEKLRLRLGILGLQSDNGKRLEELRKDSREKRIAGYPTTTSNLHALD